MSSDPQANFLILSTVIPQDLAHKIVRMSMASARKDEAKAFKSEAAALLGDSIGAAVYEFLLHELFGGKWNAERSRTCLKEYADYIERGTLNTETILCHVCDPINGWGGREDCPYHYTGENYDP